MYNENTILRAKLGEPVHVAVAIGTADEPALAMLDALPAASAVGETVRVFFVFICLRTSFSEADCSII